MSDLIAFLRRCLDEDEQVARAATPGPWRHNPDKHWRKPGTAWFEEAVFAGAAGDSAVCVAGTGDSDDPQSMADAAHIVRHDPARVLARVAADRAILDEHGASGGTCRTCRTCCGEPDREVRWDGEEEAVEWARADKPCPCPTVRLLAQPYAGRDGWQEEWRTDPVG